MFSVLLYELRVVLWFPLLVSSILLEDHKDSS